MNDKPDVTMTNIRVAGVPEHFNLPWHLAVESGAFAAAGLSVEWTDYPGGTGAMAAALRNDDTDVAVILTEGIITDIAKGNPSVVTDVYVQSPLVWGIHTGAGSAVFSPDEFPGQVYAISRPGSGSHLMAMVDAMQRGIAPESLNFCTVNNLAGALQSLTEGSSGLFLWEKYTTKPYVDNGTLRRVGECPTPWPCFVLAVRQAFLARHPQAYEAMKNIVMSSAAALKRMPEAPELIAQRYGLQLSDCKEWLADVEWAHRPGIPEGLVEQVTEVLKKVGVL